MGSFNEQTSESEMTIRAIQSFSPVTCENGIVLAQVRVPILSWKRFEYWILQL